MTADGGEDTPPPERDPRVPVALRIAAGLLGLLAVLVSIAMASMLPGGVVLWSPGTPSTTALDVAHLRVDDGWSIPVGHAASVILAAGTPWGAHGGDSARPPPPAGTAAIGVPPVARQDEEDTVSFDGEVLPDGRVTVPVRWATVELDPSEPRVAAPVGSWLICVRPASAPAPDSVEDWRRLVAAELQRAAAEPEPDVVDSDRSRHVESLCRAAALLGAVEAAPSVHALSAGERPHAGGVTPACVLDPYAAGREPGAAVREFIARSEVDRETSLRALLANAALPAAMRTVAERMLAARVDAPDPYAVERKAFSLAAAAILALLLAAAVSPALRRHRRGLAAGAFAAGLALAGAANPALARVAAPAVGLAAAAVAVRELVPTRRGRMAFALLAVAAAGHLVRALSTHELPVETVPILSACAALALVLVPPAPRAAPVGQAEAPPRRPARSRAALPTLALLVAESAATVGMSFLLVHEAWMDWVWPRTAWDVAVWLAAPPVIGRLVALGRGAWSTLALALRAVATLYLGSLHLTTLAQALVGGVLPGTDQMPNDAALTALLGVVAVFALVRIARWARR